MSRKDTCPVCGFDYFVCVCNTTSKARSQIEPSVSEAQGALADSNKHQHKPPQNSSTPNTTEEFIQRDVPYFAANEVATTIPISTTVPAGISGKSMFSEIESDELEGLY